VQKREKAKETLVSWQINPLPKRFSLYCRTAVLFEITLFEGVTNCPGLVHRRIHKIQLSAH